MFAFILTVIYSSRDMLQAPRDFDLGVLIYAEYVKGAEEENLTKFSDVCQL